MTLSMPIVNKSPGGRKTRPLTLTKNQASKHLVKLVIEALALGIGLFVFATIGQPGQMGTSGWKWDFELNRPDQPPSGFTFARTGSGRLGHYENNYGGAVKRLNAITVQLESLDFATAPVFIINGLKREELITTNSMILHELYFDGLGNEGGIEDQLKETLARDFGSLDRWRTQFVGMGKALGGGSGWVLLTYQSVGVGSYVLLGGSNPGPSHGYVRARLPYGLRRSSGCLRRGVHGKYQLGKRFRSLSESPTNLESNARQRFSSHGGQYDDEPRGEFPESQKPEGN